MLGKWPASSPIAFGRWSKQKRQRFAEARGECGETASHLERLFRYQLIEEDEVNQMLALADRVCALCTGLIRQHS